MNLDNRSTKKRLALGKETSARVEVHLRTRVPCYSPRADGRAKRVAIRRTFCLIVDAGFIQSVVSMPRSFIQVSRGFPLVTETLLGAVNTARSRRHKSEI
jgi:hypothetical protein